MKSSIKYMIVLAVLLIVMVFKNLNQPPSQKNTTETYAADDKIPYGAYIAYTELKKLHPSIKKVNQTPYKYLDTAEKIAGGLSNLIIIQSDGKIDDYEWGKIKDYVSRGNNAFISSDYFNNDILKEFGLQAKQYFVHFDSIATPLTSRLVNPRLTNDTLKLNNEVASSYFETLPFSNLKIMGVVDNTLPNFVEYTLGSGKLYLHSTPKAFCNLNILQNNNYKYSFNALSYLPARPLLWDEYYKFDPTIGGETGTPLKYVLAQPALRWAFNVLMLGAALFFIFRAKRWQKAIPVITPLANTSLEFTETIGRLYFNKGNHQDIALKKIQYLIQHIYSKYGVRYQPTDDSFVQLLAEKSGIPHSDAKYLYWKITETRKSKSISADELMKLTKKIDDFYKKAK